MKKLGLCHSVLARPLGNGSYQKPQVIKDYMKVVPMSGPVYHGIGYN